MKSTKIFSLLLIMSLLFLGSCVKEIIEDPIKEIPEVKITASLNGTVVDEAQLPLENVSVRVGANSTFTDVNGVFSFNNIEMNQNGTKVSVEKDAYFNNTKLIFAKANKTSISKIMLIEKKITSTFDASIGGNSIANGGAKITIPADAVVLESGETYSGMVNVYATWLDPIASDLNQKMPGDLRGTNVDDEAVKLVTYGMIGVELEGENGESLNIADGLTATIEVPVPSSLLGSAPTTIPLWHFDGLTGYWLEDGEGTLTSDNTYVGSVSHFSFWNYDVPFDLVSLEGIITDSNQNGLAGLEIVVELEANGMTASAYTDYDGFFEGFVPQDEALIIKVLDQCYDVVYTGQIGPFAGDAVIPDIAISNATNSLTVIGSLTDCDNAAESNGYVLIRVGDTYYQSIEVDGNGMFDGTINVCNQLEVTVSGVGLNPFSQGTSTIHDISGTEVLDVGTLVTCW